MAKDLTLDALWESAAPGSGVFDAALLSGRPPAARRYLTHALAQGAPLARAVRLAMRGEIRIGRWRPFVAEQVIADHGFIWRAQVRMLGLPITGFDRLVDGQGAMRWRLCGLLPFLRAEGPDLTRSARGRLRAEHVWLPTHLAEPRVAWIEVDGTHLRAAVPVDDETEDLELLTDGAGRLRALQLLRWADPDRQGFRALPFGGVVEAEGTFQGLTIPTRIRVGWWPGTDRFEEEGEFFRAEVTAAAFK